MHFLWPLLLWNSLKPQPPGGLASHGDTNNNTYLTAPSNDSWYSPPSGWESKTPGTVLRLRPHAYTLSPFPIKNVNDTFQALFRTTDSHGNASWAVTTVFTPTTIQCNSTSAAGRTKNCNQTHGILSYHPPYDTSCVDASPGYGLQWGEPYGEMAEALARGWWVSVPDYEGPLAAYGAGLLAGRAILDSVRAVLKSVGDFGFPSPDLAKVAMWGYSNGATATQFAAEVAGTYAPDLDPYLVGAAVGGQIVNVSVSGPLLNGKDVAGLLIQGLIGITAIYPDQRQYLLSRLKPSGPYNSSEFLSARSMSGLESLLHFKYQDVWEYFIGGRPDAEVPLMTDLFNHEGATGNHGTPSMPVFIYTVVDDAMSPIDESDKLVTKLCAQGANILYHRNSRGGHNGELTNGRQRALDFLGTVLDGKKVPTVNLPATGCRWENLTYEQNPNTPFV
ncbi:LIP-domain-containing protein [Diplogelasinospora grovesii]|uniref:LIP-domain-containing protein n=1 Tax=Diplogelasinospora grovesii TaxID=303347 RepID=A0AAN6N2L3_9PEZI|nr:LIP-domain-containing protein [Diplogelasinospora grovesii]